MRLLLLLALGLCAPVAAHACRGEAGHHYVILRDPPSTLPAGAVLLKVRLSPGWYPFDWKRIQQGLPARVLAGDRLTGKTVRLRSENWTSCNMLGPETGYVVGFLTPPSRGVITVAAMQYRDRQYRTPDEEWSRGYERPQGARP